MQATLIMQQEAVPIVKSGLKTKRKALEFTLRQYRTNLTGFDKRHRMTSEQFGAGELGDEADWFAWEYMFDAYRETTRQLELRRNIQP